MINVTLLFLIQSNIFSHSPSFTNGQASLKIYDSRFHNFFQSLIHSNVFPHFEIYNSKFSYFINSPIIMHCKDKIYEDLKYNGKRFKIVGDNLIVKNSFFENNHAKRGGGLDSEKATVNIKNSVFSSNSAIYGGGVYIMQSDKVNIENTIVYNNTADYIGGAFIDGNSENSNHFLTISELNITHNTANEWTGGIRFDHGGKTVKNSYFNFNKAKECGGMFDNSWKPSNNFFSFVLFSNNSAKSRSGAFCGFHIMHQSIFDYCIFVKNFCTTTSDSIYIESIDSKIEISNCIFEKKKEEEIGMRFEMSNFIIGENVTFSWKNASSNRHNFISPNTS